jgi:NADH:ubiquinone oxidoreductase subunit E
MTKITAGPSHTSLYTALDPVPGDAELLTKVRALIDDLSPDNAELLTAFHRVQQAYGYVPRETIPVIATKFRTTPAMLYGALDFYSEIRTVLPAETVVEWCSGPACLLKGSMNIRRVLESVLGCEMSQNTDDGAFGLRLVQCDGTCHLAPLVRREGRYIGPLSVSDTIRLARELKGEGEPEPGPASGSEEAEEAQHSAEAADEQQGGGA